MVIQTFADSDRLRHPKPIVQESSKVFRRGVDQRSVTMAQGLYKHRKGRRGLPPAGVVDMVTRERRAPIRHHGDEPSLGDVLRDEVLHQVGQSQSGEGRLQPQRTGVEGQLPFDTDLQVATVPGELPDVQATAGR